MATSPIYNWPEPDNTDLVKNGALAMRTLGDAIDTTMATMVPKTIVDAKGDLIAGTAADTAARLAVGNNGETLVADSSTSTGLRYQGSQAAAKNIVINGDMNIWQRGTSFSVGAFSYTYTADRWQAFSGNACTISQETTTVPSGSQYALKITGGATTSGYEVWQPIETANAIGFANQTITGSLLANGTTGSTVTLTIDYSTSTDVAGSGSWTAISPSSGTVTMTSGTYTKVSTTVAVPSTAKSLRFRVSTSALTSGQFVTFGKSQLELGSVATTFSRAGGTIQGELAACQRYYWRTSGTGSDQTVFTTFGYTYSTTNSVVNLPMPVTMRVKPTAIDFANLSHIQTTGAQSTLSALTINNGGTNVVQLIGVSGVITVSTATAVSGSTTGTPFIGLSAEL